jgi:hypothetical protein
LAAIALAVIDDAFLHPDRPADRVLDRRDPQGRAPVAAAGLGRPTRA